VIFSKEAMPKTFRKPKSSRKCFENVDMFLEQAQAPHDSLQKEWRPHFHFLKTAIVYKRRMEEGDATK